MGFDREAAKKAATSKEQADPEMDDVLRVGRAYQIDLLKEGNRHKEALAELGWFSKLFGGKDTAPTIIASLALLLAFIMTGACMGLAALFPADKQFWFDWSKTTFAISGTALGFIFGRRG